jgi:threonine synthase
MCPHTAVAYLGLQEYSKTLDAPVTGIFLSTAHYAKFLDVVEEVIGEQPIPERLSALLDKEKQATKISTDYEEFKRTIIKAFTKA